MRCRDMSANDYTIAESERRRRGIEVDRCLVQAGLGMS